MCVDFYVLGIIILGDYMFCLEFFFGKCEISLINFLFSSVGNVFFILGGNVISVNKFI